MLYNLFLSHLKFAMKSIQEKGTENAQLKEINKELEKQIKIQKEIEVIFARKLGKVCL